MADIVDALANKLQSKICYHRDAMLEYLEIKAMVDKLVEENKKFRDEKMEYLDMINAVIEEKQNLEHNYQVIKEQVTPMEKQLETVKKELAVVKQLAVVKYEHVAENHENVVSKKELLNAKEQLALRNEELVVLRKKLQESEDMHTQLRKQKRRAPVPQPIQFKRVEADKYADSLPREGSDSSKEVMILAGYDADV